VDRVREERDAAREGHDDDLEQRGRQEAGERPLESPDAPRRGGDYRIEDAVDVRVGAMAVVAVRPWLVRLTVRTVLHRHGKGLRHRRV